MNYFYEFYFTLKYKVDTLVDWVGLSSGAQIT